MFLAHRSDGLVDEPPPGWPVPISVDQVEQVVVDTLDSNIPDATHWLRANIAEKAGLSKSAPRLYL